MIGQDRLTIWKIEIVLVLAAVFCAVIRAAGLFPGVLLIYISIPLWSVAIWLMLNEGQSAILRDVATSALAILLIAWLGAWLVQYAFGVRLPPLLNRLKPAMLQYIVIGMGGGYWIASRIKARWHGSPPPVAEPATASLPPAEIPSDRPERPT